MSLVDERLAKLDERLAKVALPTTFQTSEVDNLKRQIATLQGIIRNLSEYIANYCK